MRYTLVTETYPPEVNGVALTVHGLELGLRERGHAVALVRPRQPADDGGTDGTLLVRGAGLPRYPGLRFGLPATRALTRHWQAERPDAIYVATEGPLGWSALRAARRLGIPAATGFHTRFDDYVRSYAGFVRGLRARWPQARFVLWSTGLLDGEIREQVQRVLADLRQAGEDRVEYVAVDGLSMEGCHWHPSLADHERIAALLVCELEARPWIRAGTPAVSGP